MVRDASRRPFSVLLSSL